MILGGPVMDLETGRDEIANVGVTGERIQAITVDDIRGPCPESYCRYRRAISGSHSIIMNSRCGE